MYYQITFTLDKKIRGKFEMPHTIELDSKSFLNYITEKNRNILMYFKNKKDLYINMSSRIMIIFLKESSILFNEAHSCSLFASSGIAN